MKKFNLGIVAIGLALLALLAVVPAMAEEKSVLLSGHASTLDLPDGWTTNVTVGIATGPIWPDSSSAWIMGPSWEGRTGKVILNAFHSSDWNANVANYAGNVGIYALNIPSDELGNDTAILDNASFLTNGYLLEHYLSNENAPSVKDITFNDRPARLIEGDNYLMGGNSFGVITFKLNDKTVVVIDVDTTNGRAWDIINGITVK